MFWNVRPMRRAVIWCGVLPTSSVSLKRMLPELARYTPVIRLKTVVLPAPLGPMSPISSPSSSARLKPASAHSPPK